MLSAIAARKAALAANPTPAANAISVPVAEPQPPVVDEPSPSHSRPPSKRKSSSQTPNSSRKRKKKREAELKKARYFEPESDPFRNPDDVIIIDSDDDEVISDALPAPITRSATNIVGKRAWSPSAPINDSSDEEAQTLQTSTSFSPLPDNTVFHLESEEISALGLSADTAALIALYAGQTIGLLGAYTFTVLQGAVCICGTRVPSNATAHHVYAPRSSPIPIIEGLDEKLPLHSISAVPARLGPMFESYDTLVAFQPLDSGVEGLGRICRTFDGVFKPSRWHDTDDGQQLRLPGVHMVFHTLPHTFLAIIKSSQITKPSKDIQPFILPSSWETALNSISDTESGIYLIKGHKKSGKSSFARTLLNRLLCRYSKVAFLECDPGQSEFTPGGLVALNIIERHVFGTLFPHTTPVSIVHLVLGPPFTHPTLPSFAHYIGMSTPRSSPSHYLASIQSLVETYQLDVQTPANYDDGPKISDAIPLIVNTMGWTKGLGADLTRKIEDLVQPTDIFEVEAPIFEHSSSFDHPLRVSDVHSPRLHLLQPITPSVLSANYSASDHRSISILSYFHSIFPRTAPEALEQVTAIRWNTTNPFVCSASVRGMEDVVPSEINRVLNGALVGLVACEPGSLDEDINMSATSSDADAVQVAPVPYIQGYLRPLPSQLLSKCRVLVKGDMELPLWGMLDFRSDMEGEVAGVEKAKVPYLQWGKGEGLGGEKRRVRRNLMRKGQM
ncbi:Polynucleotide 5'-hydroxyl-kinase GRC3 [Mycena sanguinolenta]|uniref:Polynucleotide 5'-hydroxyl-kinase GRC3 n=1 Tax=Mycena sanguinolenta TaxID=230812 RepID=A0A8H6Z680_9AGAR|nr:Polynucleotide 5'-hydroxyl-kinase GRC3 [Mycena sanguinolenta]